MTRTLPWAARRSRGSPLVGIRSISWTSATKSVFTTVCSTSNGSVCVNQQPATRIGQRLKSDEKG